MSTVDIEVDRYEDHLIVRWSDARARGQCRFDRIPGTTPEWLGSADDLLNGADRRQESRVLDAVGRWASDAGLTLGVWHDDAGIDLLA